MGNNRELLKLVRFAKRACVMYKESSRFHLFVKSETLLPKYRRIKQLALKALSASPGKNHFFFLNRQHDIVILQKDDFLFKKNPRVMKKGDILYQNPLFKLQHLRKQA